MDPEEKNWILRSLGYVGETLDKPGRFFRGAGSTLYNYTTGNGQADPRAMLNIVPFSDAFGLTDPNREPHARELYAPQGYNAPNDGSFGQSVGDAVVDIATDPSTYFSLGVIPLAKAGINGATKIPKLLGYGAKAASVVPEAAVTASKVLPEVAEGVVKVAPDVMDAAAKSPSILSTSFRELPDVIPTNSFENMTNTGIASLESRLAEKLPFSKVKGKDPVTGMFVYSEKFPIVGPLSKNSPLLNASQNGIEAFPIAAKTEPAAFAANKPLAQLTQKELPFANTASDAIEKMDPQFLDAINAGGKGFDYTADLGKVVPLENTIKTFTSNIIDDGIKGFDPAKIADYASDLGKVNPVTSTVGGSFAEIAPQVSEAAPKSRSMLEYIGDGYDYATNALYNTAEKIPKLGKVIFQANDETVFRPAVDKSLGIAPKFLTNTIPNKPNYENVSTPKKINSQDDPWSW